MTEKDVAEVQEGLAAANINDSEVQKLQEKQRAAVQRAMKRGRDKDPEADEALAPHLHPDLQDLSFGTLGADQRSANIFIFRGFEGLMSSLKRTGICRLLSGQLLIHRTMRTTAMAPSRTTVTTSPLMKKRTTSALGLPQAAGEVIMMTRTANEMGARA